MINPWLEIPYEDYEGHMLEVGQAQVLNALVKACLSKYSPKSFALPGCAGGNGLEHISQLTRKAYAIDINPDYLAVVKERFRNNSNISTIHADIQHDKLPMDDIELIFIGLVLEYVDPEKALANLLGALSRHGSMVLVIQKSSQIGFVSGTGFESMEKLKGVASEVNETNIDTFLSSKNFTLVHRKEIRFSKDKSFVVLEYTSKKIG